MTWSQVAYHVNKSDNGHIRSKSQQASHSKSACKAWVFKIEWKTDQTN